MWGDSNPDMAQEDLYKASVMSTTDSLSVYHIWNPQRCQMHRLVCGLFVINELISRLPLQKFCSTENDG
jgi:hypothetical protein